MTTEDLMKPRYKVMIKYPRSPWRVGFVAEGHLLNDLLKSEVDMREYPEIFKRLAWWEDRDEKDMPEYIRLNQKWIEKVVKHHEVRFDQFEASNGYYYQYDICTPATQSEYEQFINPSK